jgi:catechol 2,3-dioxygenase
MIETTGGKARYGRNGLLQIPEGVGAAVGLGHLAWELRNEVELVEGYGRAKAEGVPLDMTVDHQVAHSVYLPDPDGNTMEYYCDTVKNWRSVLHGEMELITAGWDPEEREPFTESLCEENPEIRTVAEAPVHPRRVTHAVLLTADVERLARFYREVGGLDEVHRDDGVVFLRGSLDRYLYHLVLCRKDSGDERRFHHVSFELADEKALESALRALGSRGVEPAHVVDSEIKRSFFLRDPDGLLSEYSVRRAPGFPDFAKLPADARPLHA